jgi:rfaE bifunctional protein nucleotidyltransferase chain/domain
VSSRKIRDRAQAVRWRQAVEGLVVFTNGVFDLLHRGHVELLEQARALGQALVVGLNDDESARRLGKGPCRPVNCAADRARVLAALEAVDCVVIFPEETPESLIRELRPDILVKGSDYRAQQLPGREAVEQRGGKVVLIDLLPGYSTSAIIQRIRGAP